MRTILSLLKRLFHDLRISELLMVTLFSILLYHDAISRGGESSQITRYDIMDITLTANGRYNWYDFPVDAVFRHVKTGSEIKLKGFWNGGNNWVLRFSPILEGKWTYSTISDDPGLDKKKGTVHVIPPTQDQINTNPNYRGRIGISENGRYFEYSDGTPFFLLVDTDWAINTIRCGFGENKDGPFYQYLADRKSKGFTAILMKHMRGTGDTRDPDAQANEGGYPFNTLESKTLNPEFFRYLDFRMNEILNEGFVTAMPAAWFGKRRCFMDLEWAKRFVAYLMTRYGAYNGFFAAGGEYQYAFRDCGWNHESYNEIGKVIQQHNSYQKPISLHPSSNITLFPEIHNVQSSKAYHHSAWLDHNWIQSGQQVSMLYNVAGRSIELYGLDPVKPVFLSEGYYERYTDSSHVYHSRWQPWTAFLNGAAGFGYGAWGMWQFYDPSDSVETMTNFSVPWWETIGFEGGNQMKYVRRLLTNYNWWEMKPSREILLVDGKENTLANNNDISPPHCASIPGDLYICYIPRGNGNKTIEIKGLTSGDYLVKWYNPRTGTYLDRSPIRVTSSLWTIPHRPLPDKEDWVFVMEKKN